MSRLERRYGQVELVADAVANFRRSIEDVPSIGTPRIYAGNAIARPDEISLFDTNSGNKTVRLPIDAQMGAPITIANYGTGTVTVVCPPGTQLLDATTTDSISTNYCPRTYVKVSPDRFMVMVHDVGNPDTDTKLTFVAVTKAVADYTQAAGLTCDGNTNDLDISAKVPAAAAGQLIKLWAASEGDTGAPAAVITHFRDYDNSAAINGFRFRSPSGLLIEDSGWVVCNSDRKIKYNITSGATNVGMAVIGYFYVETVV